MTTPNAATLTDAECDAISVDAVAGYKAPPRGTPFDINTIYRLIVRAAYAAGAASVRAVPRAAQDVSTERERQVSKEGWTPEHDDRHRHAEIALAAAALAVNGTDGMLVIDDEDAGNYWGLATKHKEDRRRQLVISGALIIAEIERLDRAALSAAPTEEKP